MFTPAEQTQIDRCMRRWAEVQADHARRHPTKPGYTLGGARKLADGRIIVPAFNHSFGVPFAFRVLMQDAPFADLITGDDALRVLTASEIKAASRISGSRTLSLHGRIGARGQGAEHGYETGDADCRRLCGSAKNNG